VLEVSCAADARYIAPSAAMLHSVLAHRGEHGVRIHYLHGPDFPNDAAAALAGMAERMGGEVSFLEISPERVAGLPEMQEVTSPMWYRIFLPELLPDVPRILYLDVDTIVLDELTPLWETNIEEHYVAAVTNVFQTDHLRRPWELGLSSPTEYFNSGVLLMNLELMRRDGCAQALQAYALERADELVWPDQDALNVVLGPRRLPLHPRWNAMNSILRFPWAGYVFDPDTLAEVRRRPAIRHFEGPSVNKPWHELCDGAWRDEYFAHLRRTPWPRPRMEGASLRNRARVVARRVRRRLSA
jgi:lipopolysaccharide biosynthesis glycosyltransferase